MLIEVSNVNELQAMENDLSEDYVLVNNIDASDTETWNDGAGFEPIGTFIGTLLGLSHSIHDLYIDRSDSDDIGLFSVIDGARIESIHISAEITGRFNVGILAGRAIAFSNYIMSCSTSGSVTATGGAGGLLGESINDSALYIAFSSSSATISSTGVLVGGFIGKASNEARIINCYANGDVSGGEEVGGFCGRSHSQFPRPLFHNCYAIGHVSGNSDVGGFLGKEFADSIAPSPFGKS